MADHYNAPPERPTGGCISAIVIVVLALTLAGLLVATLYFGTR